MRFYDHAEVEYIWGQDLVYICYKDGKTDYPMDVWLYEEEKTNIEQAKDMIEDAEEKADVPA